MIDFSALQGLTIPEGVVTQIESGGVVLWMAKPSTAILTFPWGTEAYLSSGRYDVYLCVTGDGISGASAEVPVGTVMTCSISGGDSDDARIIVNGTTVASGTIYDNHPLTYDYTVTGNATITMDEGDFYYYISITEE